MKRWILFITFTVFTIMLNGCSWAYNMPEAMITLRVIGENGEPIENADVRIGFAQPRKAAGGVDSKFVEGKTDKNGLFTASHRTIGELGYEINKINYYGSYGEYRYKSVESNRLQPWNQEFRVILRKIENPVPMYAIRLTMSKTLELPKTGTEIGFDLIERDWVAPYGKGTQADLIFKADRKFVSNHEYDGTLTVTFANKYDGIILHKENRINGSYFKLPRYAPEDGYKASLTATLRSL